MKYFLENFVYKFRKTNLINSDIRLENILLDRKGYCKIIGFSFSINFAKIDKRSNGLIYKKDIEPLEYLAPEYTKDGIEYGVDYWSLGIVNYKILTNRFPFLSEESMIQDEVHDLDTLQASNDAKDFISNLLIKEPTLRLGSKSLESNIKDHPFFKDIDWEKLENGELTAPSIPIVVNIFI